VSYLDEGEFERWKRSALRTLESARRDLDGGDYNWACFKSH
jgi:HEPN domain-containing protein